MLGNKDAAGRCQDSCRVGLLFKFLVLCSRRSLSRCCDLGWRIQPDVLRVMPFASSA
jgi:hypothetical protein